jgi:(2R)-sulfolactate sulfo-lyase subunit alpha
MHKFLVHKRGDHVGVAVTDIEPGETVEGVFMDDDSSVIVDVRDAIPLGHKIAIAPVGSDGAVLEYGLPIGRAPRGLEVGVHVHTHNLRSARW